MACLSTSHVLGAPYCRCGTVLFLYFLCYSQRFFPLSSRQVVSAEAKEFCAPYRLLPTFTYYPVPYHARLPFIPVSHRVCSCEGGILGYNLRIMPGTSSVDFVRLPEHSNPFSYC
ncbi:uncharacterized protein BO88DRAFT_61530 [Aspergillus vadensis CBS 113365]|uniref:Uncharacterized protein n=1 Tax=Aspergillus vadensis (strain CBS 113365 / IMI 142717 / IBT 24658) TaxID=1448311 RepID=A0A319B9T7_ASPVC|nr:hypothetical protein BO88DRAFT_61530 [Aspergillus vadensis CBS 113365]PYH68614.1 hypothetical protein BO88DRAFT_61530 [Aspergillus vadensis CBS 113365]